MTQTKRKKAQLQLLKRHLQKTAKSYTPKRSDAQMAAIKLRTKMRQAKGKRSRRRNLGKRSRRRLKKGGYMLNK